MSAYEDYLYPGLSFLKFFREGERGKEMPAGASPGYYQLQWASFSTIYMFKSTPTASMFITNDVPP